MVGATGRAASKTVVRSARVTVVGTSSFAAPAHYYPLRSHSSMTISWDPPAIDQRNGNITYYRAILTPLQPGEPKLDQNVGVTNGRSVTYDVSSRKAYTFKVAAATMKGLGPYSPVLSIDPDPAAALDEVGTYTIGPGERVE
uniref:Fibronectin type-III domain-containing protein n=1 Tax=Ascaris lumbricoides TaxID=6252 RepID=A0A9J2P0K8_ASCLU